MLFGLETCKAPTLLVLSADVDVLERLTDNLEFGEVVPIPTLPDALKTVMDALDVP